MVCRNYRKRCIVIPSLQRKRNVRNLKSSKLNQSGAESVLPRRRLSVGYRNDPDYPLRTGQGAESAVVAEINSPEYSGANEFLVQFKTGGQNVGLGHDEFFSD